MTHHALHVQISDLEALDTDRALQAVLNGSHLSSVASLQLLVRLLHNVRPDWMSSFPAFRRWQDHTLALLGSILHWTTTNNRQSQVWHHGCHYN
jgi:hypothetical protein